MRTLTQIITGILIVSFNLCSAQPMAKDVDENNYASSLNEDVRYYYFPNVQAYFDTKVAVYLYQENGEWIEAEQLAPTLRNYSVKNGQYIIIKDYVGEEPYTLINEHKAKYPADLSSKAKV